MPAAAGRDRVVSAMRATLARYRVALGFVMAALTLWLAQPTLQSVAVGAAIAAAGALLRLWAAGHVEKSREVTSSGPYRFTRHPLYLGSSLVALGIVVAARHLGLAIVVGLYLAATLVAAMRAEEAHLREKFGAAYDAYAARQAPPSDRRFSWERALRNREHHAILGLMAGLALLLVRVWYTHSFVGR